MFLIKCKCGCVFTLKEERFNDTHPIACPDCREKFFLSNFDTAYGIKALEEKGSKVDRIPDSSKVSVTFDISVD